TPKEESATPAVHIEREQSATHVGSVSSYHSIAASAPRPACPQIDQGNSGDKTDAPITATMPIMARSSFEDLSIRLVPPAGEVESGSQHSPMRDERRYWSMLASGDEPVRRRLMDNRGDGQKTPHKHRGLRPP